MLRDLVPRLPSSLRTLNDRASGNCVKAGQWREPLVGIIMGSTSDWETMRHAADTLDELGVPHETKVVSAHRTPQRLYDYAHRRKERGLKVIIAGAGGAAHLARHGRLDDRLPVLGVPVESQALKGMDSLLSIVQMPAGIPVGTLAIGKPGAINAALLAAAILASRRARWPQRLEAWREAQTRLGGRNARMIDSAGLDHRHHRRRPARPDAGDRRGPARLRCQIFDPHRAPVRRGGRGRLHPRRIRRRRRARRLRRSSRRRRPTSSRICRSGRWRCSATSCGPGIALARDRAGPRRSKSASSKRLRRARRAMARRSTSLDDLDAARRRARRCRWCSRPAATAMTARARPGSARAGEARRRVGRDRRRSRRSPRPRVDFAAEFSVIARALGGRPPRRSGISPQNEHRDGILRRSTVPAATPIAGAGRRSARRSARASPKRSTMSACSPSNSSPAPTARWSTRSRRASTTAATGRSRAR